MVADSVKRLLAYIKNYALIMTVKQFNCFQRCSAYQTKTMMLSAISVLLLFFISICSASEIYILAIQQVNKSLTIGKYTDYTITSCVMRCKNNKKCAGIAFSELPTSKEKETFDCYLLQSKMVGEPEETLSQDASERNKMIGIQEVRSGFESFCNIFVIFFFVGMFLLAYLWVFFFYSFERALFRVALIFLQNPSTSQYIFL